MTEKEQFLLQLMVAGYDVQTIMARCAASVPPVPVTYEEVVTMYADRYREIAEARRLQEQEFLTRGLGRRVERARRMALHAEALETKATATPAWSKAYVDTLQKLDAVLDPIQRGDLPVNDPWVMFLDQLKRVPRTAILKALESTTPDGELISDDSLSTPIPNGWNQSSEVQALNSNSMSSGVSSDSPPQDKSIP